MEREKVIEFLIEAKRATYAGNGPERRSSRPNSHDLEYEKANLKYIDTYLGGENFAGEEALWDNDKPFWSMNYIGRIIADGFRGSFLKEALLNVPAEMPYRGPQYYEKDNYVYKCTVDGDFDWFSGYEEIYNNRNKVYECMFHGGSVKCDL